MIYMIDNYNFEIHLTVDCNSDAEFIELSNLCKRIDAKVISINLEVTKQIMTSKTINTTYNNMIDILHYDECFIRSNGFKITRTKVESCPRFIRNTNSLYNYVEIHVPCIFDKLINFDLSSLVMPWHKSFNLFKENSVMLTCRTKNANDIKNIDYDISRLYSVGLIKDDFKRHYEYAIIDSNINLDKGWID